MPEDSSKKSKRIVNAKRAVGVEHPLLWSVVLTLLIATSFAMVAWVVFHV